MEYNLYNDAYIAKITAKRYNVYLREEKKRERKKIRYLGWINRIISAIFWLLKLINDSLEKFNIKKKRVIEKVLVE